MSASSTKAALGKCLVTGASGFLGRALCSRLKEDDVYIRALLRGGGESIDKALWDEQVLCDLNDFEQHGSAVFDGIETIFYLASIVHNKAPASEHMAFNRDLCLRFARAAVSAGVKKFIYVSSTKAVAEPEDRCIDESFTDLPLGAYGLSKREAEEGLLQLRGFEHLTIVRPCLIYGADVRGNLDSMCRWIADGIFPPMPDTGNRRSMVSVNDVADALVSCAILEQANRQTYIVTDGNTYSAYAVDRALRSALEKSTPLCSVPASLLYFASRVGDLIKPVYKNVPLSSDNINNLLGSAEYSSKKIQSDLGWKPQDDFYKVAPEMVDKYKPNRNRG